MGAMKKFVVTLHNPKAGRKQAMLLGLSTH